jgi:CubicO group peptidase (beta-lactamase class C family)
MRIAPYLVGLFAVACLLLGGASAHAQSSTAPTPEAGQEETRATALPGVDSFLDGLIGGLMTTHDIPGAAVAVVENGQIVLTKGYGFADVARTRPVDPNMTLFRPGSISKLFTWMAVMQLVEQGKLDLNADVNDYLTQFKVPEAWGEPVTVSNLLSHTAGFEDGAVGFLFHRDPKKLTSLADALKRHAPRRVRPPGEFSSYSNWGAALAGLIVANVSGVDFDTYVETRILDPLGMSQSTFREPPSEGVTAVMSDGFYRRAGDRVDGGFEYIHDFGPAGSMSTTAVDMAKFMLAVLNDGASDQDRVLKPETARLMRSRLFSHDDRLPGMLHGYFEMDINGRPAFGHGGDTIHFHSDMVMLQMEQVGIFVTFNSPESGRATGEVVRAFFNEYFPRAADPHPAPGMEGDKAQDAGLEAFVGTYRTNRRSYTTYEKVTALGSDLSVSIAPRGGLLVTGAGEARRFVPLADGLFRSVDDPGVRIAFRQADGGRASHVFLSVAPPIAFERIGVLESSGLHLFLLAVCGMVGAGVIAGSIWGAGKWMRMAPGEKVARGLVFAGATSFGLFVLGLLVATASAGEEIVFTGVPGIGVLVWLPVLGATAAMAAAGMLAPVWGGRFWSLFGRVRYTMVVAVLLIASALAAYWNLMGPWAL